MNQIILILAIELCMLLAFLVFIYRLVKRDIKRYQRQEPLSISSDQSAS